MVWYYAEGNQQRGPLSDAEFEEAIGQGRIRKETLVWSDGMENWQSLAVIRPGAQATIVDGGAPADSSQAASSLPPGANPTPIPTQWQAPAAPPAYGATQPDLTTCSNCGRNTPVADITRFGAVSICSLCKPSFLAQVRQAEGATPAAGFAYAPPVAQVVYGGFWLRATARSIDHILISILQMIFLAPLLTPMQSLLEGVTTLDQAIKLAPQLEEISRQILPYVLLLHVVYHALFVSIFSATPGKMLLKLRVIGKEGGRVTVGRAITRAVVPALLLIMQSLTGTAIGTIVLMVGYLMVAFDPEKRSLFDRLAATRVIRRKS